MSSGKLYRTRGLYHRVVVTPEDKAAIVEELKRWKADGGLDRALGVGSSKTKIKVLGTKGMS